LDYADINVKQDYYKVLDVEMMGVCSISVG
jgi:hypothetical protein